MINILRASAFNKLNSAADGVLTSRFAILVAKNAANITENPPIKPETPALNPKNTNAPIVIKAVTASCNRNILLKIAVDIVFFITIIVFLKTLNALKIGLLAKSAILNYYAILVKLNKHLARYFFYNLVKLV